MEDLSNSVKRTERMEAAAKDEATDREWNPSKRWNPFNSYKLLAHVQRWKQIRRGKPIPPPVLVTVDPSNACNLNCEWCNARFVMRRKQMLSERMLSDLADFLPRWGKSHYGSSVEAICVAGGGEPLLNPATPMFIEKTAHGGIDVGVVTNGTRIYDSIDSLSQCIWLGVSVDAGSRATFNALKGLAPEKDHFDRIMENISILMDYAKRHNLRLGYKHPSYGVSYKYLLYRENIGEVFQAAKLAKEIGCKNIHFRPAGTTWDKLGTDEEIYFTQEEVDLFKEQIALALELDDETFSVYGITHKFNSQFGRANYFSQCYAVFMTAVIMPPSDDSVPGDSFILGLCCDRRGDGKLELARDIVDVEEIDRLWGGKAHWKIHDKIAVHNECPRCTYQPHNEIYEQVILNDSMTYRFI
jgi:MoaA/NifB/PqqE/SkfB family radical SAM enzyme